MGSATTLAYNGDGLRESKTFASNTTTFTWDLNRSIPQVLDDETLQYLYGIGRIAQRGVSETHYYLTDGLGSTLALSDEAGGIVNAYEYDVFGSPQSSTGSQPNDFRFTGEQLDGSTGLQYLRARYYDPSTGRFISRDTMSGSSARPLSQNRFSYVEGHPIRFVDPWGLCKLELSWDNAKDCAEDAVDTTARAAEKVSYGAYAGSYGALQVLGQLPIRLPYQKELEIALTYNEALWLVAAAVFDYIPDGEIINSNSCDPAGKEGCVRKPQTWWFDDLENLLGGDSEDENCWFPCTVLPGIRRVGDDVVIDFRLPFGIAMEVPTP